MHMQVSVNYSNYNKDIVNAIVSTEDGLVKFSVDATESVLPVLVLESSDVDETQISTIKMNQEEVKEFHLLLTQFIKQLNQTK